MREFILLALLVAFCHAAPTSQQQSSKEQQHMLLNRPSPINPDIPSDPKPEEKIVKITDPKEIMKHKRETGMYDPYEHISRFAPTVPPTTQVEKEHSKQSHEQQSPEANSTHHRQKRDEALHILDAKKPANAPASSPTPSPPTKEEDKPKHTHHHNVPATISAAAPTHDLQATHQRRQVDPHLIGASSFGITPLIYHDDQGVKEEGIDTQNSKSPQNPHTLEVQQNKEQEHTSKLDIIHESMPTKRDIPVPLVPKYHHPEESPKSDEIHHDKDKSSQSDETDEDSKEKKHQQQADHQQKHPQIATEESIKEPAVNDKPVVEAGNSHNHQANDFPANPQADISTLPLLIAGPNGKPIVNDNPLVGAGKPESSTAVESEIKPLEEQLDPSKPTQIIAYETPASDNHVAIKHPVPVSELFPKPKE